MSSFFRKKASSSSDPSLPTPSAFPKKLPTKDVTATIKLKRVLGVDQPKSSSHLHPSVTGELGSSFSSMCQQNSTGKLQQRVFSANELEEFQSETLDKFNEHESLTPSDTEFDASTSFSQNEFDSFSTTSEENFSLSQKTLMSEDSYLNLHPSIKTTSSSSFSEISSTTPSTCSSNQSPRDSSISSSHSSSSLSSLSSSSSSTTTAKPRQHRERSTASLSDISHKNSSHSKSKERTEGEGTRIRGSERGKSSKSGIFKTSLAVLDSSFSLRRTSESSSSPSSSSSSSSSPLPPVSPRASESSTSHFHQEGKRRFKRGTLSSGDITYFNDIEQDLENHGDDIIFGGFNETTATPIIIGATPDRLVERLTFEKYPDPHLIQVFLLTYRSFMTPHELLEKLKERWRITLTDTELSHHQWVTTVQKPIQLRVFNVLKLWLLSYFKYDFLDVQKSQETEDSDSDQESNGEHSKCDEGPVLLNSLKKFILNEMSIGMEKMAAALLTFLEKQIETHLNKKSESQNNDPSKITPKISVTPSDDSSQPKTIKCRLDTESDDCDVHSDKDDGSYIGSEIDPHNEECFDSIPTYEECGKEQFLLNVKKQRDQERKDRGRKLRLENELGGPIMKSYLICSELTRKEWKLFQSIEPKECLNRSWIGSQKEKNSPNILKFIERFNRIAKWVATEILSVSTLEQRVRVMEFFIDVAQHLRELKNLNGVMEILGGLQTTSVYRLKTTWATLSSEKRIILQDLTKLMNSDDNFSNFRKALSLMDPPCIPFLGVFLTDLVFIEEGNPSTIGEKNLVNFKKLTSVADVLLNIQRFQKTPYHIERNERVRDYLENIPIDEEEQLMSRSLTVEPRVPRTKKG